MSDKILVPYVIGRSVWATMTDANTGQMWNVSSGAWATFAPGSASAFALLLTDANGIGVYSADSPITGNPANICITAYDVAGASWVIGDTPIGGAQVSWSGFDLMTPLTGSVYVEGRVTDASPLADQFIGNAELSSVDDFYCGPDGKMKLVFTEGVLKGLNRQVIDYVGATRKLIVKAFPVAPSNGDCFYLMAGN